MAALQDEIRIRFSDGEERIVPFGTTAGAALAGWKGFAAERALAARFEGVPIDLSRRLLAPGELAPLTYDDADGRSVLNHSAAHLVAKALLEAIPEALPTNGPADAESFHYDFDVRPLTPEDVSSIEHGVRATVLADPAFVRLEVPKSEALTLVARNPYKTAYVQAAPDGEPVSFYRTGDFLDLCRGPHVPSAGRVQGLHLLGTSAITLEAESGGRPLQRVRGVAFPTRALLEEWLARRKEAEARDHRHIGQRLELFSFVEESPGFPFWWPNGMIVVRELERFVLEHLRAAGYSEIRTPLVFPQSIFETSGHWEHYRSDMFLMPVEDRVFSLKPMNCPGSMLIFRARARSYRELPMRLAEFAPLHRLEPSGTLHGLTRVREFVQDDAHIFVTDEQIGPEIRVLLDWIRTAFTTFRLDYSYELSTRPASFLGEAETWERAEKQLRQSLVEAGVPFRVAAGEGAFYAPKIDIHVRDSLGRSWQTGTIQLDYQMPRRFGLSYQGSDGQLHAPAVIHRTILGTWERFLGVFLEHCAGRLPPWLAPVQVRVLPVGEAHAPVAAALAQAWAAHGLRVEALGSQETLGKRVRQAELDRIPYVVVVGDAEVAGDTIALRIRGSKGQKSLSRAEAVHDIVEKVRSRAFDP